MTRAKACEEKTPDRSSSIFAGFSNPLALTNRNSEGQELHLYFKQKLPVQPILSMNKSSCNFKQKAIWQLTPRKPVQQRNRYCSEGLDTSHKIQVSCQGHTRRVGNVHNNAILAPLKKGYIFSLDSILVFISFLPPSHPLKPVEMA